MEFVDTHCHPHFSDFKDKAEEILANARAASVNKMIAVGVNLEDSRKAIEFAAAHENIWASVGTHPHDAKEFNGQAGELGKLLKNPKVVAYGEIGLDYYKLYSDKADQKAVLRQQINIGLASGLPFIFHVRDAWDDFFEIFDNYKDIKGVVHSFSATPAELDEILSRNLYVGLNGIMTFTKDDAQLEAAKKVPLNRLLLETDAPYLSPAPRRGKTCEPSFLVDTAKFLADLRSESLEELAAATTKNARELFSI